MSQAEYKKGDVIGQKYEVHEVLGKGGCGVVYAVYDRQTDSVFALKTFLSQYMNNMAISERFKKEARVWVALERHPFIVTAFYVDNFSGRYFVALEYIPRNEMGWNTLDDYLRNQLPNIHQSLKWAIQFCHGMEYAYSKGIKAHRDIKPANIMIDEKQAVRIADFGLAGIIDSEEVKWQNVTAGSHQTIIGTGMGTPTHMAPEQFVNAVACDERSDIYSFGVVLYQMATGGRLPFSSNNRDQFWAIMKHFHAEVSVPKLDSPLSPIISKCMAKEPIRRYQTFINLRDELAALLKSHNGGIVQVPIMPPFDEWEWNNKSRNLNKLGLYKEAIRCADKAISFNPAYGASWGYKADALHNIGKFREAIDCYLRALNLGSNDSAAWGNMGLSYRGLLQYDKALECYDNALKIEPKDTNILNNKGACLALCGKLHEAISCYDVALSIDKSISSLWSNKGSALIATGDIENGIKCLNESLSLNPNNNDALKRKAEVLMKNNFTVEAIRVWERLIEINLESIDNWFNLGLCYFKLGDFDKASSCLCRAEELSPDDVEIWHWLMGVNFKNHDAEKTLKYGNKLLAANQYVKEATELIQKINQTQKTSNVSSLEIREALQQLKNAEAVHFKQKSHAAAIKKLIQLYLNTGDKKNALYYCDVLIKTTNYITDFGNKAMVMSYFGDYDGAVGLLTEILQEWPQVDTLWYVLSSIHEQHGKTQDALLAAIKCHELLMKSPAPDKQNIADVEQRIRGLKNK